MRLQDAVIDFAARTPRALAVSGPDGRLVYGELDRLANRVGRALLARGVEAGDRVAIWTDKSTVAVAAMQAVLRCGAAYVPVDPLSPASRARAILDDCAVAAIVTNQARAAAALEAGFNEASGRDIPVLCVDGSEWQQVLELADTPLPDAPGTADALAYILYTSGSTGRPKGVCISHTNALAFTCWAAQVLAAVPEDRFSNHAPFHFDLSVLDLYVAFQSGGSVHLIADGLSFAAERLVDFVVEKRLTVWYSVPSVLILMMEHAKLLETDDLPLRAVLFAGEPFAVKHLRRLRQCWPELQLMNLYGPTETNVCTYYEVGELDPERTTPVPIGRECSGDRAWAVKDDGTAAAVGEEGELIVSGPTVMLGYWGREPQAEKPYATGDLVRVLADGGFDFVGRRDHMVKIRGHRIELGEIEAALQQHDAIRAAAVVVTGAGLESLLVACLDCRGDERPSLLSVKQHLAQRVPRYMIVDRVRYLDSLPKSRTGKIDRLELGRLLAE